MVRCMLGFVPCSTESIYLVFATNALNSTTQPDIFKLELLGKIVFISDFLVLWKQHLVDVGGVL